MAIQSMFRIIKSKSSPFLNSSSIILSSNKTKSTITTTSLLLTSSFSTSNNLLNPTTKSTTTTTTKVPKLIKTSLGSGKGGRTEKDLLAKLKLEASKEKAKLKVIKDKEKALSAKLKAKASIVSQKKEKVKKSEDAKKVKAKAKALKDKLKIKVQKAKVAKVTLAKKAKVPRSSLHPPKAAPNSWGVFLADFLAERKASTPAGEKLVSATKLASEAAPLYKELAPSDRAELDRRSAIAREAYPALFAAWKATLTPSMIREENTIRRKRKASGLSNKRPLKFDGEPKKPTMPFILFSNEVKANQVEEVLKGETNLLAQSKLVAAAWRELSADQKQLYEDQYAKAKEVYLVEKKAFLESQEKKEAEAKLAEV